VKSKLISVIFTAALLSLAEACFAQGFVNLNFEQAAVSPTPAGVYGSQIDPAIAFPGWTVGNSGGNGATVVFYNEESVGSPAVDLMGPSFPNMSAYPLLQGSYSVLLQYFGYAGGSPTLTQTGTIPTNAQSITFLDFSGINPLFHASSTNPIVTLNGINIPLISIAGGRLAGDVTAFAGSVVQLTFSTPTSEGGSYFDDIQFSSLPVPEPSAFALAALGALLLGLRRRHS
jgi:hypothetical protein